MDYYYPERISDDDLDDESSIEGSIAAVDKARGRGCFASARVESDTSDDDDDDDDDALYDSSTGINYSEVGGQETSSLNSGSNAQGEQNSYSMAAMIQHERNRRLGVQEEYAELRNSNEVLPSASPLPERVFSNIRGWFGGGGGGDAATDENGKQGLAPSSTHATRKYPNSMHEDGRSEHMPSNPQPMKNNPYNDNSSSSNSSDESSSDDDSSASSKTSNPNGDTDFTPQERALERALRYLSNSCIDAGRKSKTASYIWGLERLDLTRKRDRFAKELEIVELEMNKDRGLTNHAEEGDPILHMAEKLVQELPRIQGTDAGAGIDLAKDNSINSCFMMWEEYADHFTDNHQHSAIWDNKGAVDAYVASLQRRLKEAVDRTRSLENRLVVLENAGDDIISSLCEDLAEITEHSYKTEAKYIKKGKELKRKRLREELRQRVKIKQAEHRVRILEAQLMAVSGDKKSYERMLNNTDLYEDCDVSTGGSTNSDNDDDNEVVLEKELSIIRSRYEQEKNDHKSELESIRRQCEQLKLHLSVARLVMEGDDNLSEYIALLERCDSNIRRNRSVGAGGNVNNYFPEIGDFIPSPPSRITRARAKLLKVIHLERIYEQRLVVSKAFTDATIKALDQELIERETLSHKMEVRCLNELVSIDVDLKHARKEAFEKCAILEKDTLELQDAISAFVAQNPSAERLLFAGTNDINAAVTNSLIKKNKLPSDNKYRKWDTSQQRESEQTALSDSPHESETPKSGTGDITSVPIHGNDRGHGDTPAHECIDIDKELSRTRNHRTFAAVDCSTEMDTNCDDIGASQMTAQQLGLDLKSTLASYKESYHSSTSSDRIEHLNNMNYLVAKIGKLVGTKGGFDNPIGVAELTSWSFKKASKPSDVAGRDQKHLKKKKKRRIREQYKEIKQPTMDDLLQLLPRFNEK